MTGEIHVPICANCGIEITGGHACEKARPVGQYLIEANDAYPDGYLVENYFDLATGEERRKPLNGGGDTLALFVGREIVELYDENATDIQNRREIIRALKSAKTDLDQVINHFAETVPEELG